MWSVHSSNSPNSRVIDNLESSSAKNLGSENSTKLRSLWDSTWRDLNSGDIVYSHLVPNVNLQFHSNRKQISVQLSNGQNDHSYVNSSMT